MRHILNSYISEIACCFFVTEEMDGVNLFCAQAHILFMKDLTN
jgi:hypothetical protein